MTPPLALVFGAALILLAGCAHAQRRAATTKRAALEALRSEVVDEIPRWMRENRLPARARRGAVVFATSGCTTCHTYLGSGTRNLGARDLSAAGRSHGRRFFTRYVANPARFANNVMPSFAALGRRRLNQLGVFLGVLYDQNVEGCIHRDRGSSTHCVPSWFRVKKKAAPSSTSPSAHIRPP